MFGLLNINKPSGRTSRDVVDRIQRLVKPDKVGHAGTLDPLATGVLVIAVGGATRLVEYLQQQSKSYVGTFLLGRRSDSEDVEQPVELLIDPPIPTRDKIEEVLPRFIGEIQQMPPAFSALKVAGKRAYKLARRGEEVQLAARPITIHALRLKSYDYPTLELEIDCGSGTYVRSLGRDIARALGSDAVMSALVRTRIGPFHVEDAIAIDAVDREELARLLQPAQLALAHLGSVNVTEAEVVELRNGRTIAANDAGDGAEIAAIGPGGRLIAIVQSRQGRLHPVRVFP